MCQAATMPLILLAAAAHAAMADWELNKLKTKSQFYSAQLLLDEREPEVFGDVAQLERGLPVLLTLVVPVPKLAHKVVVLGGRTVLIVVAKVRRLRDEDRVAVP